MKPRSPVEGACQDLAARRDMCRLGAVVAVSGGVDSVVLLHLARRLAKEHGIRILAAHFDHGMRGDASIADRQFVVSLCADWRIPCSVGVGDVWALHEKEGGNLEAIARRERYRFLVRVAREEGIPVLLTGHTADDRVETMLMNLLRGAGPRGLAGIRETGDFPGVHLFRPLIRIWREDVLRYAAEQELLFREDATNRDTQFLRNWVRLQLLPELESQVPHVRRILLRQAELFESEDRHLAMRSREFCAANSERAAGGGISFATADLLSPEPWLLHGVLRQCLEDSHHPKRVRSSGAIYRLATMLRSSRTTWTLDLPGGFHVRREYNRVVFGPEPEAAAWGPLAVPVPGETVIPALKMRVRTEVHDREETGQPEFHETPFTAAFDADRLPAPLFVRSFRAGDRLHPRGMEGTQKIKRIFSDRKVPRWERLLIPILCSGDEPIWVVGYRLDRRFAAGPETRRLVRVSVDVGKPG